MNRILQVGMALVTVGADGMLVVVTPSTTRDGVYIPAESVKVLTFGAELEHLAETLIDHCYEMRKPDKNQGEFHRQQVGKYTIVRRYDPQSGEFKLWRS